MNKPVTPHEITYRNPWHDKTDQRYGAAMYRTSVEPVKYRGHLIYHRIGFDVVRDGLCIGQYHGLSGAKRFIDLLLDGTDEMAEWHRARVASYS